MTDKDGWAALSGTRPGLSQPLLLRLYRRQLPILRKEQAMNDLNPRERELVALGAAMGSNCVPCIEYHIPEARKAGLTDSQICEAVRVADKVRRVPARKVLDVAMEMLPDPPVGVQPAESSCAEAVQAAVTGGRCCG